LPDPGSSPRPGAARIAVLVSGQGRNLQALSEACDARQIEGAIVGVISNRADAAALLRAQAAGLPFLAIPHRDYADRAAFDAALGDALDALRPDIVVLAGFMRVLGPAFVRRFLGRLVNIHPSLLPKYPGLHTHRRALEAGDAEHGATVHFVTEELDGGPPVIQGRVSVQADDTPDTLAERVMTQVETRIYPQAIAWMARGDLVLREGRVLLGGAPVETPRQLVDLEAAFR
jgi:phosphoribosylglycinamide formyltransferase 1